MKRQSFFFLAMLLAVVAAFGAAAARPPAVPPATSTAPAGLPPGIQRIKLWEHAPAAVPGPDLEADPTEPTLDLYLPPPDKATGVGMLVLPGGSYSNLAIAKEGTSMAQLLLSKNIAAFVVRYRHAPRYHHPVPLMDAQRAIRIVRSRAGEFHLDPQRIGIIGFSAGGHLAASTATFFSDAVPIKDPDAIDKVNPRPDFAVLMYPVINLTDESMVHQRSREALTLGDKSLIASLSLETRVTKETPPIFLAHGTNDRVVPVLNSVVFYQACVKAQVPAELHIFENGPHGFGLAVADPALKVWPELMFRWMERHKWLTPAAN